jgi:hypothetical protein
MDTSTLTSRDRKRVTLLPLPHRLQQSLSAPISITNGKEGEKHTQRRTFLSIHSQVNTALACTPSGALVSLVRVTLLGGLNIDRDVIGALIKLNFHPSQRHLSRYHSFNPLHARVMHVKRKVAGERKGTYPRANSRRFWNITQGEGNVICAAMETISGIADPTPCIQCGQQRVGVNLAS